MANIRETIALTTNEWTLIPLDPDTDNYTRLTLFQLTGNHFTTQWSPTNTVSGNTDVLSNQETDFINSIYVRNLNATAESPVSISVTRYMTYDKVDVFDHALNVARGKVPGSSIFDAYGRVSTIGAASGILWADGAWLAPPASGTQIKVQSSDANDSAAGTGIRTLVILYIDTNLQQKTTTVTLNGLTSVIATPTDVRFVQCAFMSTYGTLKKAAGTIIIRDNTTDQIYNQIDLGQKRCTSSARIVPAGKRLVIYGFLATSVSGTKLAQSEVTIASSKFEGYDFSADSVVIEFASLGLQDNSLGYIFPIPKIFDEGTIVAMEYSVNDNAIISGSYFGVLEDAT